MAPKPSSSGFKLARPGDSTYDLHRAIRFARNLLTRRPSGEVQLLATSAKALNRLLLAGRINGDIGHDAGQTLAEDAHYDRDSGEPLSGSFFDRAFSLADAMLSATFDMNNNPCKTNPLDLKARAKPAIGAPRLAASAIVDAIYDHTGVEHANMPVTAASYGRRSKAS